MADILELPDLEPQRRRVKIGATFYDLLDPADVGPKTSQWLLNKSRIVGRSFDSDEYDEDEVAQALAEIIERILPAVSTEQRQRLPYISQLQIYNHWSAGFIVPVPEEAEPAMTASGQTGVS